MGYYRKKPVVIEAFKWTGGHDQTEDPEWIVEAIKTGDVFFAKQGLSIKAHGGTVVANVGDYVIKGVNGEIYPCPADVFIATYEEVLE